MRFAFLKTVPVLLIVLSGLADLAEAAGPSRLALRVYGTSFWNCGWDTKFFFHTGRLEDWDSDPESEMRKWYHTLQHYSGPNLEVRWVKPLSQRIAVTLSGKYQHFGFRLGDSFVGDSTKGFAWITQHKALEAKLDFLSVGAGIQMEWKPIQPYINADVGYCLVDLTTSQIDKGMFSSGVSATLVSGRGGGIFYRWVAGGSMPVWGGVSLFAESSYLFCGMWDQIPAQEVRAILEDDDAIDVGPASDHTLVTGDRQISRIHGFEVSLGIELAIR